MSPGPTRRRAHDGPPDLGRAEHAQIARGRDRLETQKPARPDQSHRPGNDRRTCSRKRRGRRPGTPPAPGSRARSPPGRPATTPQAAARLAAATAAIKPAMAGGISAELGTFAGSRAGRSAQESDTAVLVCTDTAEALLAGLWNAAALTGGVLSRIRYLPLPRPSSEPVRGTVLLTRIKQLDATRTAASPRPCAALAPSAAACWTPGRRPKTRSGSTCPAVTRRRSRT